MGLNFLRVVAPGLPIRISTYVCEAVRAKGEGLGMQQRVRLQRLLRAEGYRCTAKPCVWAVLGGGARGIKTNPYDTA